MYNSNTYTGDDEDDMTMFAFEALDKVASYVGGQLVVSLQSSKYAKESAAIPTASHLVLTYVIAAQRPGPHRNALVGPHACGLVVD